MFSGDDDEDTKLTTDKKLTSEIISFFSLVFSIFIVIIAYKKISMNMTNKLIIQIILSEILDGTNIMLAIFFDLFSNKDYTFENYPIRMGFCTSQIFLGVFSCLWNLFASFCISLRIFDKMANQNRIFKNKFLAEYTTTLSYGIPCLLSFIIWSVQMIRQSSILQGKTYNEYYPEKNIKIDFFRYMYCWISGPIHYVLISIAFLLIFANFYFSIIKSCRFMKNISRQIQSNDNEESSDTSKLKKMNQMMRSLILYPSISCLLWLLYFLFQIFAEMANTEGSVHKTFMRNGPGSWILVIIISIRQFAFTFLFFWTQGGLKRHVYEFITCKTCKNS